MKDLNWTRFETEDPDGPGGVEVNPGGREFGKKLREGTEK